MAQLESVGASSQTFLLPTQRSPQGQQVHPALQGSLTLRQRFYLKTEVRAEPKPV